MKKYFFITLFGISFYSFAQVNDSLVESRTVKPLKGNSTNDSIQIFKTKIDDYKFWTENSKQSIVDTTLSIKNFYNQNFIKQDLFGKMMFPNVGSVVMDLEMQDKLFVISMLPFGKKYNYYGVNDVRYFDVKTPYTEFIYEAGVKEGSFLSTTFSHNLNSRFNYTLHYRGLNSEGRFRNEGNKNNSFVFSSNYKSKNERLKIQGHFASQKFDNQENGGVKDIYDFIYQDDRRLTNVRNIEMNMRNSRSEFDSRRVSITGVYGILNRINASDSSVYHPIQLKNSLVYEKQKMRFEQGVTEFYTSPVIGNDTRDKKYTTNFSNITTAGFQWTNRLKAEAGIKFQNVKIGVDDVLINTNPEIQFNPIRKDWTENLFGAVANIDFDWNEKLRLRANGELLQGSNYDGLYHIDAALDIQPINGYTLTAGILAQSNIPSLNLLYNQSYFADFNYFNQFDKENTQKIYGILDLDKLNTTIEAAAYNIDNYVYTNAEFLPTQLNDNINYFKLKLTNHLTFAKNFNLVSTIQYQNVTKNKEVMPLPDLILRETFYWQGKVFDGKGELQAGLNAYYFTGYNAFQYFPVTGEMMMQNGDQIQEIGDFPIIDAFINFKVQNMRFYIRGEHLNSMFSKEPKYFSAPGVPYRAFKIQLGLKWNIFT
ncbi:putative porin [Faecalibacter bovis]|uniref:Porin n=1 Tax=Faecalibacter bovis TaxID=2898187 RepID=A0ABX7XEM0_9FLAO|nr:putative porin [Faecalibacter bovis]QTV06373.1 putative porin [Faecalibacter bovis]